MYRTGPPRGAGVTPGLGHFPGSRLPRHWQPKLPQSDIVNWAQQYAALVVVRGESSDTATLWSDAAAGRAIGGSGGVAEA